MDRRKGLFMYLRVQSFFSLCETEPRASPETLGRKPDVKGWWAGADSFTPCFGGVSNAGLLPQPS